MYLLKAAIIILVITIASVNHAGITVTEAESSSDESYSGDMIDAHSHLEPKIIGIDGVISLLDQAKISRVVLAGQAGAIQDAYEKYPDRVIPSTQPFDSDPSTGKLVISQVSLDRFEITDLNSGFCKRIGEIMLRHRAARVHNNPADSPVMLNLYDLAAKHGVPVTIHLEFEYSDELERALEHNRKAIIVWAHCGDADPPLIRRMMSKHPNLFADLSASLNPYSRGPAAPPQKKLPTNANGSIKPEWKQLFEDYSDRLMFGVDMGISRERYEMTVKVTNYYRSFLSQLSPRAAENIAYKTMLRILPATRATTTTTTKTTAALQVTTTTAASTEPVTTAAVQDTTTTPASTEPVSLVVPAIALAAAAIAALFLRNRKKNA